MSHFPSQWSMVETMEHKEKQWGLAWRLVPLQLEETEL
jgi:hypothetical protein